MESPVSHLLCPLLPGPSACHWTPSWLFPPFGTTGLNAPDAVAAYRVAKHGQCAGVVVDALGDTITLFGAGLGLILVVAAAFHDGWLAIDPTLSDIDAWMWLGGALFIDPIVLDLYRGRVGKRHGGLLLALYAAYLVLEIVKAALPGFS